MIAGSAGTPTRQRRGRVSVAAHVSQAIPHVPSRLSMRPALLAEVGRAGSSSAKLRSRTPVPSESREEAAHCYGVPCSIGALWLNAMTILLKHDQLGVGNTRM